MVTEEMLQNAAVEAEQSLLLALVEEVPHEFSAKFEKKIKKLTRRAKHPVGYRVLRYAAVIVLVMATLFGTVLAVSPEVRADFLGWCRAGFFGPYAHYSNEGADADTDKDAKLETEYDYYLSWIPKGFKEWQVIDRLEGKTYMYLNDSGDILEFTYACSTGSGGLFLQIDGYSQEKVAIGDVQADLYFAVEGEPDGVIVWVSKNGGILFDLSGPLSRDELIALAEGVQYRELPKENET